MKPCFLTSAGLPGMTKHLRSCSEFPESQQPTDPKGKDTLGGLGLLRGRDLKQ
jgi:hypothetical protein